MTMSEDADEWRKELLLLVPRYGNHHAAVFMPDK